MSDTHLPPEAERLVASSARCGQLCPQDIRYSRHHLPSASHLCGQAAITKKGIHFRPCAASALMLCSFLLVGATSQRAPCISPSACVPGISWPARRLILGPPPQAELRSPTNGSSSVSSFRTGSRLRRHDCSCMACGFYFVHNVISSYCDCWPSRKFLLFFSEAST